MTDMTAAGRWDPGLGQTESPYDGTTVIALVKDSGATRHHLRLPGLGELVVHRTDCNGEGRGGIGRTRRQPAVADDTNFKFLETTVRNNALLQKHEIGQSSVNLETTGCFTIQNPARGSDSGNNWLFHKPESRTRVRFWKQLVVSQTRIQNGGPVLETTGIFRLPITRFF